MASGEADDYNDDGAVDEEDFKLFVDRLFEGSDGFPGDGPDGPGGPFPGDGPFVPDFEDWLASGEAEDLNEDGEIDEADYELLLEFVFGGPDGPFPGDGPFVPDFEDWLASGEAEDLNEDGEIDEADYELLLEFVFGGPDGPFPATVPSFLILRIGWPVGKPRI